MSSTQPTNVHRNTRNAFRHQARATGDFHTPLTDDAVSVDGFHGEGGPNPQPRTGEFHALGKGDRQSSLVTGAVGLARSVFGSAIGRTVLAGGTFWVVRRMLPVALPAPLRNGAALALQGLILKTLGRVTR